MRADPHRIVERHTHDEAHFVLVLEGLYVSTAEGAPPVSAGTRLIFNPAGTTHRDRFEARDRVIDGRFLTISLSSETVREAATRTGIPQQATVVDAAEAVATALQLARACVRVGSDAPFTQQSLALDLLLRTVHAGGSASTRQPPQWLRLAREQLDDALGYPVNVAEVARVVGVHPVHLSRVFRQHVGVSPADYLRRRRLEQSRALLQHTARSLSDIADVCGFSDQSHFSNAFRAAHGVTPTTFRARVRG